MSPWHEKPPQCELRRVFCELRRCKCQKGHLWFGCNKPPFLALTIDNLAGPSCETGISRHFEIVCLVLRLVAICSGAIMTKFCQIVGREFRGVPSGPRSHKGSPILISAEGIWALPKWLLHPLPPPALNRTLWGTSSPKKCPKPSGQGSRPPQFGK